MQEYYQTAVVKRKMSLKAMLLIYQSADFPTVCYGHEVWIVTDRMS